MESSSTNTTNKTHKTFYFFQIMLRLVVIGTSLAAAIIIFTSKQSVYIFGTYIDAKYSYSSAYKFFGFANVIACVFSILALVYIVLMCRHGSNPSIYFLLFIHDLVMVNLVLAGCAAATAVGYIGKYGNMHIGWMGICDRFEKFCDRVMTSIMLSYVSVLALFVCTVGSACRTRDVYNERL